MLQPDITADDSDEWGDKLMNIKIKDFASYLEYLDALQCLLNDISLYAKDRKDWDEAWVVRCAVRGIRSQWDTWEEVIEFYAKLDVKILEGEEDDTVCQAVGVAKEAPVGQWPVRRGDDDANTGACPGSPTPSN